MLTIFKACNSGVVRNCCPIPTIHLTNLACSLSSSFLWHGFKNIASHPYNKILLQVADHATVTNNIKFLSNKPCVLGTETMFELIVGHMLRKLQRHNQTVLGSQLLHAGIPTGLVLIYKSAQGD